MSSSTFRPNFLCSVPRSHLGGANSGVAATAPFTQSALAAVACKTPHFTVTRLNGAYCARSWGLIDCATELELVLDLKMETVTRI